jgi:hypothetical protein
MGGGIPLAIQLSGANRNDSTQALSLVDAIPLLQGERGRPRHRPECVMGERGYDAEVIRRGLRNRGIISFLAKRNTVHLNSGPRILTTARLRTADSKNH